MKKRKFKVEEGRRQKAEGRRQKAEAGKILRYLSFRASRSVLTFPSTAINKPVKLSKTNLPNYSVTTVRIFIVSQINNSHNSYNFTLLLIDALS
ncbi:MAG: hypothetical protein F6K25_31375 [Okeania sp. SIO2G4]|uniref:hypothetical protein n=1 Tax=unclassified Okeania TaxID=2634635 RepID=UPI0013BA204B|nr:MULTISPECIES: hypothetical protein [unclassified Okeania]NEP04407.1 hypothetical protein [Okeania sp. SIO4D6]NEP39821.1 hypothetical protein [Okeania sp. SIO2H7]NEP75988.1 hypothetical protein [Okeania sp. SIO2G5]NEP97159.1 hypothetical protein [Okeania sp. SIO2F5]NEQ94885.1 hypothetical protein [Okeania sp. SIO2G4]